jgi:hypothetical protein
MAAFFLFASGNALGSGEPLGFLVCMLAAWVFWD